MRRKQNIAMNSNENQVLKSSENRRKFKMYKKESCIIVLLTESEFSKISLIKCVQTVCGIASNA
jgi:hypothetical protein